MIAEALESRLRQWNRVEIVNVWDGITNMLINGERCYISWAPPEKVMNIGSEFVEAGLLAIGSSAGGDIMVIDTYAEKDSGDRLCRSRDVVVGRRGGTQGSVPTLET